MTAGSRARTSAIGLGFMLGLALPMNAIAQDADADPLPEAGTVLSPGRYVSSAVGPRLDFRVESGWIVGVTPPGPIFTLERLDIPGGVITVTRFDGEAFFDSCDSTSMSTVEASLPRLAEIIAGNPFLNPAPPAPIEVDGRPGVQIDVGVPAYTDAECSLRFVLLWALPIGEGGEFVQLADQQSRFVLLDVDGDVLVVAIETFPGVPFGRFLEESMDIVRSMRIEPGEYVPEPLMTPSPTDEPAPQASPSASPTPTPAVEAA